MKNNLPLPHLSERLMHGDLTPGSARLQGNSQVLVPDDFDRSGFAIFESVVGTDMLNILSCEFDRLLATAPERAGCRNALQRSRLFREFGACLIQIPALVLGPLAQPVRATLFDKNPRSNWKVPWHQDLTISVRQKRSVNGFGPWTQKGGVPHVQPPLNVLESMVALRVHLDDTATDNGSLRVVPGSHRFGRLNQVEIQQLLRDSPQVECPMPKGGAMLMRPLLLHASSASVKPCRRRVLHYEFSARELPGGLRWE